MEWKRSNPEVFLPPSSVTNWQRRTTNVAGNKMTGTSEKEDMESGQSLAANRGSVSAIGHQRTSIPPQDRAAVHACVSGPTRGSVSLLRCDKGS
jgi:hypothetical protein